MGSLPCRPLLLTPPPTPTHSYPLPVHPTYHTIYPPLPHILARRDRCPSFVAATPLALLEDNRSSAGDGGTSRGEARAMVVRVVPATCKTTWLGSRTLHHVVRRGRVRGDLMKMSTEKEGAAIMPARWCNVLLKGIVRRGQVKIPQGRNTFLEFFMAGTSKHPPPTRFLITALLLYQPSTAS